MLHRIPVVALGLLIAASANAADSFVIAFGSCNQQRAEQAIWLDVLKNEPDLWVWLGDNIYADTDIPERMAAKYAEQRENEHYKKLVASVPVVGTWDDHDFGLNDGGKNYPMREESQRQFLDFIGEPEGSPRWEQAGVYTSYTYGEKAHQIKLILLDVRYHREHPGPGAELLGQAQWQWLETELGKSDASLTIICSGIQVLAEDHRYEKWADFPEERERFIDLLRNSSAKNVLLLSGDRHFAEIARMTVPGLGYPLYDITSSGLTHYYKGLTGEPNRHRVGELYSGLNFGLLRIGWKDAGPVVDVEIRSEGNSLVRQHTINYGEAAGK